MLYVCEEIIIFNSTTLILSYESLSGLKKINFVQQLQGNFMKEVLIKNIKELVQVEEQAKHVVAGSEMAKLPSIKSAFLLMKDGKIADFGEMKDCPDIVADSSSQTIDATGKMVFPSWCDSHTHIVYAGSREGEFVDRIKGMSYEDIAKKGGGILNSARRLQETSEDDLFEQALGRLKEVVSYGTGAIEIKSGYGLTFDAEVKMLKVIQRLKEVSPIKIRSTFLGAHAIPLKYKDDRQGYIDLIINEMLPFISSNELAEYCDVFCEEGFYTPKETEAILNASIDLGLIPKLHANQLTNSGAVQVGVAKGAISVDHLEFVEEAEINALLNSETMPTLLPSAAFFINLPFAPARKMIDAGLPVALATDYNPGSTPSGRFPFVISLACIKMKMTPEEAINAATINSAYAMELTGTHGSICKGKVANVFITKPISSLAFIPYSFGSDLIETIILNGEVYEA